MKLALAVCVALLAVALIQAEDEMEPPNSGAETRITFGRPAVPGQYPYMAYIETSNNTASGTRECGGSLIRRDAVLTSGWCAYDQDLYTVRLGSIYRTKADSNAWTAVSVWALIHPEYRHDNLTNDVAIIYLPTEAPISDYIQLVDLPSPDDGSFIGFRGDVSGWGYTSPDSGMSEILYWSEVVVIPTPICRKFIRPTITITNRSMCAGSVNSSVFWSDFGGPLVLRTEGRYMQIAIFSTYSWKYYNTSQPALFTNLTPFIEWIRLNTGPE